MTRRLPLLLWALAAACKTAASPAPTLPAPQPAAQAAPAPAPAPPPPAAKPLAPITSVEGITEYQLDNGLHVLLFPDDSQPKVTVAVTYLVGSRFEGYGEKGMAHLLEHMLFKGTPRHPEFDKVIKPTGAVYNANTSEDRTHYFEILPASEANLALALDLESDRMVNAKIAAADLAKEFSVVRNEFEIGENDPDSVLDERMMSAAYLWHNYGDSIIGSRADIERVPADSLRRFYQKYYQPDNAVLTIAGKFDPKQALALVQKDFGPIPRPQRKLAPTYTVEPVQDGEREVTLRRSGDVQVVGLVYHVTAGSDVRFPAVQALAYVLADKPTGRLYKALVKTGMASDVRAWARPMDDPGVLKVYADVRLGKPVEPVREKMIQIVEGLAKNKPTEAEIARFRAKAAKDFELAMANSTTMTFLLARAIAMGDWRLAFIERDRVAKVTAADAAADAAEYLKPSNRTVGIFYPTKAPSRAPLTERPDVAAMVKDYHGRAALAQGEVFEATVANIEKRTQRTTLPGGMKLALLAKKTRGGVVVAQLSLHYATGKDLVGHEEAAAMVGPLLMRGTKKHDFEALKAELDRLKADVRIRSGDGDAHVSIRTVRANLPAVIALVGEILRQPTLPKADFEILKKDELAGLEAQRSDPRALATTELQRKLHPYPKTDILYVPTIEETIARTKAMTYEDVKRLYRTFWGASHAEMSVVGDFDPKEVKDAIAKALGSWKTPRPYARIADPYKPIAPASEQIDTPDKANALLLAGQSIALRDDDPDYPALRLAAFILGSGFGSRLTERLRQKEGWSYFAFAHISADSIDKRATLVAMAAVAPQNSGKALAAMFEEITRLVKDGVTADEMTRAKKSYRGQFENALANDGVVASMLNRDLYLGRTLDFSQKIVDAVEKLTPEDMARVLAKGYIKPDAFVKITAGDLKKTAPAAAK